MPLVKRTHYIAPKATGKTEVMTVANFDEAITFKHAKWLHFQSGPTNRNEIERMLKYTLNAMDKVLTGRQLECIRMLFFNNMKQKDIAEALGVSRSTVSRHVNRGLAKLRVVASFYEGLPRPKDDD